MTAAVEDVLRDLQGVVSARHLYPPHHPRLVEVVERVVSQVEALTATQPEIAVFVADNRLVFDGIPLPNGETLARAVFQALRAHGYHRLALRRGLTAPEVIAFASAIAMSSHAAEAKGAVHSSAHVRLSSIDRSTVAEQPANGPAGPAPLLGEQSIEGVWEGVFEQRRLDLDAMDLMVLALGRTLEENAAAVLPLAQLKSHDDYTVAHITNVALLATALGEAIGLPPPLLRDLGIAALLHDMGKLRVPPEVLNQNGRLTDEQRALIRRHPEDGARILLATPDVPELAVIVAYEHHMHHDGGGYPHPPRPWKMNLASELTHIADVFDALRSNRPYRAGMPRERIAEIMRRDAGTVFDPTLVGIFLDVIVPRTADTALAA